MVVAETPRINARLRNSLIIGIALVLAVFAGMEVADGSFLLVSLLIATVLWVFADWLGGAWPEMHLLAVVVAGYILGNRGFAQLSISSRLPLLPAEVTLAVCATALLVRSAFRQVTLFHRDALNIAILLWIVVAAGRLPLDWRTYGIVALRDFAMVYYAAFFFIGQALGRHPASARWLRSALTVSFVALPPIAFAFQRAPEFFFRYVAIGSIPLVYHKNDLVATFLVAGFFWFWWKREQGGRRTWLLLAAISFWMLALSPSPRAAMVGILAVTLYWIVAKRWRLLGFEAGLVTVAIAAAVPVTLLLNKDIKESPLYSAYEHAISVVDFQGTGTYLHTDSGDPGGNNRFRLVWWRAVLGETLAENPVFGLGFGYDLTTRFLADYDLLSVEEFGARSPHSMAMSVLGRMGLLGFVLWLAIAGVIARKAWLAFSRQDLNSLGWWSVVGVIWVASCFGVVLEGPMGAVVFWTILGIANSQPAPQPLADAVPEPAAAVPDPSEKSTALTPA